MYIHKIGLEYNMAKTVFLTFGNDKYREAMTRIEREAGESGFFDVINVCSEKDFDPGYWLRYGEWIESNPRGYGYWIWKSYFIKTYLDKLEEGDFLIYLDSGCEINKQGRKRFKEYLDLARDSTLGMVCFTTISREGAYDKGDVLDALELRDNLEILDSAQIMGTIIVICKNARIVSLVNNWYEIIHENLHLIDDSLSVSSNPKGFVENRHDQSVLSLLVKKTGGAIVMKGFDEVEIWPMTNRNWRRLLHTPFHAVRRNLSTSRVGNGGPWSSLMNVVWGWENVILDNWVALRITVGSWRKRIFKI